MNVQHLVWHPPSLFLRVNTLYLCSFAFSSSFMLIAHRKYSFVFYIDALTGLFCKYVQWHTCVTENTVLSFMSHFVTGPHRWRLKVSHVKWIFTCDTFRCHRCEANFYMCHLQASRVRTCDTFTCHWCLPVTWVTAQYTILHCDILDGFFYRRSISYRLSHSVSNTITITIRPGSPTPLGQ